MYAQPAPVGRPPVGKQAAYAAAQRQMPTPAEEDENRTEKGGGSGGVTPSATEQGGEFGGVAPAATEQGGGSLHSTRTRREQSTRSDHSNRSYVDKNDVASDDSMRDPSEGAKTENEPDDLAACRESPPPPLAPDDINVGSETSSISDDSYDGESAFCEFDPDLEECVDEVESDSDFEDEGETFRQYGGETKGLEWKIFDQHHCGTSVDYRIRDSIY
ncbi:hypothetical protein DVH05_010061 [Phytophthora capsici]|nr:hypothetical protein DVH05_010061 [Phytophthora capsici]